MVIPSHFPPGDPKLNDFDINEPYEPYEVLPEIDHDTLQKAMGQITTAKGCTGLSKQFWYSMLTHQPDLVLKLVTMIAHNTCPAATRVVLNTYHMTTLKKEQQGAHCG